MMYLLILYNVHNCAGNGTADRVPAERVEVLKPGGVEAGRHLWSRHHGRHRVTISLKKNQDEFFFVI